MDETSHLVRPAPTLYLPWRDVVPPCGSDAPNAALNEVNGLLVTNQLLFRSPAELTQNASVSQSTDQRTVPVPGSLKDTQEIWAGYLPPKPAIPRASSYPLFESQNEPPSQAGGASSPKCISPIGQSTSIEGEGTQGIRREGTKLYKCVGCGKGFWHLSALTAHRIRHLFIVPPLVTTLPSSSELGYQRGGQPISISTERKVKRMKRFFKAIVKWIRLNPSRRHTEVIVPAMSSHIGAPSEPSQGRPLAMPPTFSDLHQVTKPLAGSSPSHYGLPSPNLQRINHHKDLMAENHQLAPNFQNFPPNIQPVDLTGQVTIPDYSSHAIGGMSIVYHGLWNGIPVAVKILTVREIRKLNPGWWARANREIDVASMLKHPNINEFYGYSKDFEKISDFPAMISRWCYHGTIRQYLEIAKAQLLQRVGLALGVCAGLQYLHQHGLVHGDIKPTNVLVNDELVACLCDHGCVQPIPGHGPAWMATDSPYMGTEQYKARELFHSPANPHPVATPEGDIYSLGCLLMEIVELIWAFQHISDDVLTAILKGESPGSRSLTNSRLPADLADQFWDLLEACWGNADSRPTIQHVVEILSPFVVRV